MTTADETEKSKILEFQEAAIRRACKEACVPDRAEQFIKEGRSWVYVRDWLIRNTLWRPKSTAGLDENEDGLDNAPKSVADIDVKAVYDRFNNPKKKLAVA